MLFRSEISEEIVRYDARAPRPEVVVLVFCLRMRRFPLTLVIIRGNEMNCLGQVNTCSVYVIYSCQFP